MKIRSGNGCAGNCRKLHLHLAGRDGAIHSRFVCRNARDAKLCEGFKTRLVERGFQVEKFAATRAVDDFAASLVDSRDIKYFAWSVPWFVRERVAREAVAVRENARC